MEAFEYTIAKPCPVHGAAPGEGCWTVLGTRALCGSRLRAVGIRSTALPSPHLTYKAREHVR